MIDRHIALALLLTPLFAALSRAEVPDDVQRFGLRDVFHLEFASDPQISPDGKQIVYVRNSMDIMKDRKRSNLWMVSADGSRHRAITSGNQNDTSPRWSPRGDRLAYVSSADGSSQIYLRWMDTGQTARLTQLTHSPSGLCWSPDGKWLAFRMFVPKKSKSFIDLPSKPEGAKWAPPPKMIDKLIYRYDGQGYLEDGYHQIFVLPSEGGTPRQLTFGEYQHRGELAWSADSRSLIFSANRHDDWEYQPLNSELYEVSLAEGKIQPLTDREGPDEDPAVSPDGRQIAYVGFDDRRQGYQVRGLYVLNRKTGKRRLLAAALDRSIRNPVFADDGLGIYFRYDDRGDTKVGYVSLDDQLQTVASNVGGTSLGRPYASGSFSVAKGKVAYTQTRPARPADVALATRGQENAADPRLVRLNDDLFGHKKLGSVEEFWFESSHDQRKIQGWVVKPPEFVPGKKYPLILEIHGGPFANYGGRFSAEMQLFAAAGYVVLYINPRGSTGYGAEFGNLIHHAYPGHDYDDLMSGVDAVLDQGYVDPEQLFVTGGSGGGVLSSWIVGKTDRFRAAVVAKPVINWYSFALTSDAYNFFYRYWFPGYPWDHAEHYLKRSPISQVGNVVTPTMLITGEEDHRTPISETEQFYQALKLRKIETALVRVPDASHGIAARPSHLMAKVAYVLKWFEKYRHQEDGQ